MFKLNEPVFLVTLVHHFLTIKFIVDNDRDFNSLNLSNNINFISYVFRYFLAKSDKMPNR